MRLIDPQTDDIARLAALHARSFEDGWSVGFLSNLLRTEGVFGYEEGGGFILARVAASEAEILTLAVAQESRRNGIATRLVQKAAAHAQSLGAESLFLEVAIDNDAALKLYEGLGFKAVGRRKAYYRDRDAYILKRALPLPYPKDML